MNIEKNSAPNPRRELANRIHARAAELGKEDRFNDQMVRKIVETVVKRLEEKGETLSADDVNGQHMIELIDQSIERYLATQEADEAVSKLKITPDLRVETLEEQQEKKQRFS